MGAGGRAWEAAATAWEVAGRAWEAAARAWAGAEMALEATAASTAASTHGHRPCMPTKGNAVTTGLLAAFGQGGVRACLAQGGVQARRRRRRQWRRRRQPNSARRRTAADGVAYLVPLACAVTAKRPACTGRVQSGSVAWAQSHDKAGGRTQVTLCPRSPVSRSELAPADSKISAKGANPRRMAGTPAGTRQVRSCWLARCRGGWLLV